MIGSTCSGFWLVGYFGAADKEDDDDDDNGVLSVNVDPKNFDLRPVMNSLYSLENNRIDVNSFALNLQQTEIFPDRFQRSIAYVRNSEIASIPFTGHHSGCGLNDDITQWMDNVQNSAETSAPPPPPSRRRPSRPTNSTPFDDGAYEFIRPHEKYSEAANRRHEDDDVVGDRPLDGRSDRVRRAPPGSLPPSPAPTRSKDDNRNTCSLYIQTDPLIWRHIREGIADVSVVHDE